MLKLVATWKTCLLLLLWTPQITFSALIARGGAIIMMILYRSVSDYFVPICFYPVCPVRSWWWFCIDLFLMIFCTSICFWWFCIDLFLSCLPGAIMMIICFWWFCTYRSLSILFAQVCRGSCRSSHSQVQRHQEQQEALILVFAKPLKPLNQVVFAKMRLKFWTNLHRHHQVQRHQEQL